MKRRHAVAGLAAALAAPAFAQSGDWPNGKPITYVVPFTPGGSTDVIGRTVAEKLAIALKQSVVVDNRPGQGGAIGATYVAKAPADGYTLFGGTISTHAINASLYKNLPYDPVKDFEPVVLVATLPNVLLVDPNAGVDSVQELIALLKKDPKRRTFASSGNGTSTHLAGEMFADLIGVPLTHVPYKGTPPAMVDVAAGQVTFMFDQMTAALPLLQGGKLKLLAVTTARRMPLSPNTPTMMESGVPCFEMSSWQAIYAPKGTPKAIVDRMNQAVRTALKDPDVIKRMDELGAEIVPDSTNTPEALHVWLKSEIDKWGPVIKAGGKFAD